ncbi:MAG: SPOR domain-containing protein [Bacteroidales bacterium]|nr:SPOR domain-containing protein [Bacteroidales bacterium]MCF8403657.1 SPOR domain-containing protein [Bacteroidales bacterium]
MDIAFYISELLYSNDCVIVPGFGGFVGHYSSATIHPINHSFNPPSKNILFNSKLTRDDGLLLDFIAQKEAISYGEAKSAVADFALTIFEKINKGDKALIRNVGMLFKDAEGNILFDPDQSVNYLEDSFGLNSIVSPPIVRKPSHKKLENRFIDRKPVPVSEKENWKKYRVLIAIIPLFLVVVWILSTFDFDNSNTQQSGVMPIIDSKTEIPVHPDEANKTTNPPLESLNFEEPKNTENSDPEDIQPAKPLMPEKKYYIIGGSFSNEANADKLIGVLREKGYSAERAGISPSGLHMVSYYATEDKSEALLNLNIIRKEDNPSAWLIKR